MGKKIDSLCKVTYKIFAHTIVFLFLLAQTGCAVTVSTFRTDQASDEQPDLVVLATTDFHASLEKAESLGFVLSELKKKYGPEKTIHLDGGDLFQGSLDGNLSKGESIVEFFNLVGLDAAAIGNHELDYGPETLGRVNVLDHEDGLGNLKKRTKQAKFHWLSTNFVYASSKNKSQKNNLNGLPIFQSHAIFNRGKNICVIGASTPFTANITNPQFIRGTQFLPLETSILQEVRKLKSQTNPTPCDYLFLTIHAGLQCKNDRCLERTDAAEVLHLLEKLPPRTFDAVVAGHTHQPAQELIHQTPVIEAGSHARFVGVLEFKNNKLLNTKLVPVPLLDKNSDAFASQAPITQALAKYRSASETIKKRPAGFIKETFHKEYASETPLSNLIADALLHAGKNALNADFALINAGGLRADLKISNPPFGLTYNDIYLCSPFDNSLSIVELNGKNLRRLLEIAFSFGHGVSGVAGLKIRAQLPHTDGKNSRDLNHDGKFEDWERNLILSITDENGLEISDKKHYKLATNDFLVFGGDHQKYVYDMIPPKNKHFFTGIWVRDLLIDFIQKNSSSDSPLDPNNFFNPKKRRIEWIDIN